MRNFSNPLLVAIFLSISASSFAISFQSPPYQVAPTTAQDEQIFAERYGTNTGRLHIVYLSQNSSGGTGVFYTRETAVGNNVFTSPVLVSSLNTKIYTEPDIAVDRNGTAHICYIGENPTDANKDSVFYTRVTSGGATISPIKITPDSVVVAFNPSIAAVKFNGRSIVQPFIAYVSNDLTPNQQDTEIYLIIGDPLNASSFDFPTKVTNDTVSGEQNLSLDLVEGMNSGNGSTDYLIQGAIAFERGNQIFTVMSNAGSSTTIQFGAAQLLVNMAQSPSLAVQSLFQSPNGYAGHLVYRALDQGFPAVKYTQFAQLPTAGTINQQTQTSFPAASSVGYPSVTVEPYLASELIGQAFVTARFSKDVSVSFVDTSARNLNAARNSGGIASVFGPFVTVPLTPFTDTGFAPFFPSTLTSFGPKTNATTRLNGIDYVRVGGVLDGKVVLIQELGVPTPTVTPTPTVSPTVSLTATATGTVSPTATAGPTSTATVTPTATIVVTGTATATASPTIIINPTPSRTITPSATAVPTSTPVTSQTPSPSATAAPTLTATPSTVNITEVIDTLLGYRPGPNPTRLAQGDKDSSGFWDSADVMGFIIAP